MIPEGSHYPNFYDSDYNLYTVQDSLYVTLAQDYHPGDKVVWVEGDLAHFPASGIITLVDQCSAPKEKAVSLYYGRKSSDAFLDIERTQDSYDSFKPKKLTSVTMQLRAEHHNSLVDSIVAIESFLGTKTHADQEPNGPTLIGRINFLKNLIFAPKAWFEINKTTGLAPLTVTFKSVSGGTTGPVGEVIYSWDFGDDSRTAGPETIVEHTYYRPGIYDVTLTVNNVFGEDTITLDKAVCVRIEAPETAIVRFVPQEGQILTPGMSEPYDMLPVLRTPVGQLVVVEITDEINETRLGISNAGEMLDQTNHAIDPITNYTWDMGDDLPHGNNKSTRAAYSLGGMHDLTLRVDTEFGAYRITTYPNCIDAVEIRNMWLWMYQSKNEVVAHEFGLNNETFKVRPTNSLLVKMDDSFLDTVPNSDQQKREFRRNCGFAQTSINPSGLQGTGLLFWATGRRPKESITAEEIKFAEHNPFTDTYTSIDKGVNRPWNWAALVSPESIYFILGQSLRTPPAMSPSNQTKTTINLATTTISEEDFEGYNYINGAHEVQWHPAVFDEDGQSVYGNFAVYRTAWRGQVGYLLRNDSVGDGFTLRNFYKTDGTMSYPFLSLVKLVDVPGGGRKEGQLAALSSGIFLFSNSSVALAYSNTTGTWEVTGSGNPGLFKSMQDAKTVGYENEANTLLVASDGDRKVFLSFDYSHNTFIKFNEADLTFSTLGSRPQGQQWQMTAF